MIANRKSQFGLTLIELIIYIALVSMILVSISFLILDIMAGQTGSVADQDVNQNMRFISNYLSKDIKAAEDIVSLTVKSLVLAVPGDDIAYSFDDAAKIITRQVGSAAPDILNSNRIEVIGSFTDLSYLNRSHNVGVNLTIIYKNPGNRPEFNASTTANFSVELMGRR
ncbi:prepilin-type N-terminal cleavage/methylation domain-containing protein [Candidatus Falkowbacteria bacterium]|nr:prepilin-type N-terminal cleavage/methylation domain-containing protein [Candidatus Falkowbacteria bacterium]